ncbi:MAG: protein-disulfide reductase DsbD [Pseudomonadales bacterium]
MSLFRHFLLPLLIALGATAAGAPFSSQNPPGFSASADFLPVDEAFVVGASLASSPQVFWQIRPGYYLYRERLAFALEGAPEARLDTTVPSGLAKDDPYFGPVEVFYNDLSVALSVEGPVPEDATLRVSYQGCADAGLCYPPETRWIALAGADAGAVTAMGPARATAPSAAGSPVSASAPEGALAARLAGGFSLSTLLLFFLAGIGLAFTPCVLPMVPILSSIIVGQGGASPGRNLHLALAYGLAMAVTYAAQGRVVGAFGGALNLHGWLQSPGVLIVFAALFALLALAMFDVYTLQLPATLQQWLGAPREGGSLGSVALLGVLSSLLVSPCVSAPLAGALIYISTTGDAASGGLALFVLALGMGAPLLLVGAGGGALLPKAGAWMGGVKKAFGVGLLGVSIWLLERVLPGPVTLLAWAALALGSAVALGALDFAPRRGWGVVGKTFGVLLFVVGVALAWGGLQGNADPLRPLGGPAAERAPAFETLPSYDALRQRLAARAPGSAPVVLDLYADWCIACKVMERSIFPAPPVAELLARFERWRLDLTANTAQDRALLADYGLFGPPALLFFDSRGQELQAYRLQGEPTVDSLSRQLQAVLSAAPEGE